MSVLITLCIVCAVLTGVTVLAFRVGFRCGRDTYKVEALLKLQVRADYYKMEIGAVKSTNYGWLAEYINAKHQIKLKLEGLQDAIILLGGMK